MTTRAPLVAVLLAASSLVAFAQTPARPAISNGRLETAPGGDVAAAIRAVPRGPADVMWVAYAVQAEGTDRRCCWSGPDAVGACCQGCRLERERAEGTSAAAATVATPVRPVPLEPSAEAFVFVRVAAGVVDRIRVFSAACPLDAGGRTVVWLAAVTPAASVAWLEGQVSGGGRRLADEALMAMAAHASPVVLDRLLTLARSAPASHVRGQALFWLAQRAGDRAVGAIAEAVDRDPDTDVKRRAVFALSQLPPDDGVPRLIQIARAHSNAAVRRQAFFWLGQSKDPRALAFFGEILKR